MPYTPGEQPKEQQYIKLNTNENAYAPPAGAARYLQSALEHAQLYPDPECTALRRKMAALTGLQEDEIIFTNGSDEILNFAFMAFCDADIGAAFPDITYGFYPVFAALNGVPYAEIPLREDFTVAVEDYCRIGKTIFLANPNAPTGLSLSKADIERILTANPDNVVVIDEAYADFGTWSAVELVGKYENLLVTGTFSKSRSGAGLRLGYGFASAALIKDLNTIRFATNPYNINALSMAVGLAVLEEEAATRAACEAIKKTRRQAIEAFRALGFDCTDSQANFIFVKHPHIGGERLYRLLKERGILVRHFSPERIKDYNRITIGTEAQMQVLLNTVKDILDDENCTSKTNNE